MKEKIIIVFYKLGISAKYKGYKYLVDAVEICLENDRSTAEITRFIYSKLAEKYQTRICCIERNIRTAIKSCWEYGNRERLAMLYITEMPTNSYFISSVATYIQLCDEKRLPALK